MTISVIIPAYNCEQYIERCLESVLSQNGAALDVIVVNDGSTDKTEKVLEKYKDKIRIKTTENKGSASARNTAIEMIEGDYVMFIDADDWIASNTVERLCEIIGETNADVVRFRYMKVFPDGRELLGENQFEDYEIVEKKDFKEKIYPYFISGIRLNSMCVGIYRASLIKGRKLREDMKVAEDAVFSLGTFTKASKVVITPDVLYYYYQTGTGLTGSGAKVLQKYHCNFIFAKETSGYLKEWDMNNLKTRIKVYSRPLFLTFDKLRRMNHGKK